MQNSTTSQLETLRKRCLRLPKISLPDHVLLQAAWKTLKEDRAPEEIGGTALPKKVKTRPKNTPQNPPQDREGGKNHKKGAILRGKRKKRERPIVFEKLG